MGFGRGQSVRINGGAFAVVAGTSPQGEIFNTSVLKVGLGAKIMFQMAVTLSGGKVVAILRVSQGAANEQSLVDGIIGFDALVVARDRREELLVGQRDHVVRDGVVGFIAEI